MKYVEITPGTSERDLAAGATVPLAQGSQSNDFEDAFATFDRRTRPNLRQATEGFGTAFTGRGPVDQRGAGRAAAAAGRPAAGHGHAERPVAPTWPGWCATWAR